MHTPFTVLVTGASAGIGQALARQFAAQGHHVLALARDTHRLAALAAAHPGRITPLACDLARTQALDALAQQITRAHPGLRCVVHNAGIQHDLRVDDHGYGSADIQEELAINLAAPVALTRALLPHLLARKDASVVFVTSALAFTPKRTAAVYSASKAGLHMFVQALRVQLQGAPLHLMEVVFPLVDTAMTQGRGHGKISAEAAAGALLAGLRQRRSRIDVGKARALRWLVRLAPGLAARILQRE